MKAVIVNNKKASIRVKLQMGDIQFLVEKARELRDGLTSVLENLKRKEQEAH